MRIKDARSLSSEALEELRHHALQAVKDGMTQTQAAVTFGVARATVNRWVGLQKQEGTLALKARRRGRPPGIQLTPQEAATVVRLVKSSLPEQLRLPFSLWTRKAVQVLIERRIGLRLSVWTVGRYLKRWDITPQELPQSVRHDQEIGKVPRGRHLVAR